MCCERNRSLVLGVCLIKTKELPGITRFVFPQAPLKCHARMPRPHHLAQVRSLWFNAHSLPDGHGLSSMPIFSLIITLLVLRHMFVFFKFDRWKYDFAVEVGSLLIVEWRIFLRVSTFGLINWNLDFGTMALGWGQIPIPSRKWRPLHYKYLVVDVVLKVDFTLLSDVWGLFVPKLGQKTHSLVYGMGEKMRASSKPCLEKGTSPKARRGLSVVRQWPWLKFVDTSGWLPWASTVLPLCLLILVTPCWL